MYSKAAKLPDILAGRRQPDSSQAPDSRRALSDSGATTAFLASVTSLEEATLAHTLGADVVDLKEPRRGALGAAEPDCVRQVVATLGSTTLLSATIGDLAPDNTGLARAVREMHETGVDIVKVGVFAKALPATAMQTLRALASDGVRLALVFFAEDSDGRPDFAALRAAGVVAVMLDTRDKADGNLRDKLDAETLARFVNGAQQAGLAAGLAGSLGLDDIAPLLALQPDYLGFRGALCRAQQRVASLDPGRVAAVRRRIAGVLRP